MSGGSRVSIPGTVRRTIQDIKEISGDHSDEDIYAMLKECNMDPNETAQKLLYLDTFHEVKRKRDRRKEHTKSRASAGPRGASSTLGLGGRGGRGNYSSQIIPYDAGIGRSVAARKENEGYQSVKTKNNAASHLAKYSTVTVSGPANIGNGGLSHGAYGNAPKLSVAEATNFHNDSSGIVNNKLEIAPPQPTVEFKSPPAAKLASNRTPTASLPNLSENKVEQDSRSITGQDYSKQTQISQHTPHKVDNSESSSPTNDESFSNHDSNSQGEIINSSKVKASTEPLLLEEATSKVHKRPELIFPNDLQVPEAYKNGLIFGSVDASFVRGVNNVNGLELDGEKSSTAVAEAFHGGDETATEPCISNQSRSSTAEEEVCPDPPQSPLTMQATLLHSEGSVTSNAPSKYDQLKNDMLLPPEGPQYPVVPAAPDYSYGFVSPMLGNQPVQVEGPESQSRDVSQVPNFVGGNSMTSSTSGPTLPATQPAGVLQGSLAVSPQPVPVFRQPYPPNFFPYSHYYSPFYVPPTIHQFLGHGGFPQQPSTGSVYLSPAAAAAAAAAGVKFPLPQYKPGLNPGNSAQVGIPSGFGPYGSSAVGYSHGPAVTSGNPGGNEDPATSQSKESNIFTTGQQSEGSAVWIQAAQDISALQANSFYNLPHQGQHVAFSPPHTGHGAFPGIYSAHTMAPPPTAHPLLQQSQAMAGSVEKIGPLSAVYQQQQQQAPQINWNANY
ncbi:GBF-interacting protein 1-like isoform X2 [Malania oleifera]|uniref:GBF-interacting protein 1-like isoform X2 n=1 Tax=Malania oleifera TaxID=397392 RepID=UPI0025ADB3EB|nr:GBF-interacting protein 1-like isoform X2 [Malania oleifera]